MFTVSRSLAVTFSFALSTIAYADETLENLIDADTVRLVSGYRQNLADAPAAAVIITRNDIERLALTTAHSGIAKANPATQRQRLRTIYETASHLFAGCTKSLSS